MKFKIKAIELYSEREAKLTLDGERSSLLFIYVPIEEVGRYQLGQKFILEQEEESDANSLQK